MQEINEWISFFQGVGMESIEEKVREVVDEDVPVRRNQHKNKMQCDKNLSLYQQYYV